MIAQQVAGKATRDALFLDTFGIAALPTMLIVAAVVSIAIIPLVGRALTALGPSRLIPPLFAASAALAIAEWVLVRSAPRTAAVLVYLHIGSMGSVLISWFWSLVNERFDPRTAKREIGRIAGGASLGGLIGGLVAARLARSLGPSGMLPVLAGLHLCAAGLSLGVRAPRRTARANAQRARPARNTAAPSRPRLSVVWRSSYLRDIALLVSLGAIGSALLDYVLKAQAATAYDRGAPLLRFFAIFYTATSVATFLVQTTLTRRVLEKLGLARTVQALPAVLAAGGAAALIAPGLACVAMARGAEATVRSSLFRSAYELLYMPVAPDEKRTAKALIDVGGERLGDLAGGGLVTLVVFALPGASSTFLLGGAIALAAAGFAIARRLRHGYLAALERSLLERAIELELDGSLDPATRDVLSRTRSDVTLSGLHVAVGPASRVPRAPGPPPPAPPAESDPLLARLAALRSADRTRVRAALSEPLDPALVPAAIALLGWDEAADAAMTALRQAAPAVIGQLTDALLDPQTEFVIRRRLPRIIGTCASPRAADALWAALADSRFEVRYQAGRALARRYDRGLPFERVEEQVSTAVLREVAVDRKVWEGHRLLDDSDHDDDSPFVDQFLRERASRSLEHVFTLLSLAWPREPLIVAFRGLHTSDDGLRGTALEYLQGILPEQIWTSLWPFLEDRRDAAQPHRPRAEILAELMRSNASIELNLAQLREELRAAAPT